MFNDKLGQISLERVSRKRKQEKSRKTQSLSNFKNANGYSLDPFKRLTQNIFKLSADDVIISYENTNPENKIERNSGYAFGNVESNKYKTFNDLILTKKERAQFFEKEKESFLENVYTKNELKNSKIDIFKRNTDITSLTVNYPFPQENINYAKASIGESLEGKHSFTQMFSNYYEDFDSKDPFFDKGERLIESGVYISNKNYYNSGNTKPFIEKSNVKNNSIILEKDGNDKYYKDSKYFKTSGFVYKSKRPDSIAFGGLKR